MAKHKIRRPKKAVKKTKKRGVWNAYLIRVVAGLGVLLFLVVVAGVLLNHFMSSRIAEPPIRRSRVVKLPRFEIYPKNDISPRELLPKPPKIAPAALPKIAIIHNHKNK